MMNTMYFYKDSYNLLLLIIIIITGSLLLETYIRKNKHLLNIQETLLLINRSNAVLVDIRPIKEFNKSHVFNSLNIPKDNMILDHKIMKIKKPLIIICNDGSNSMKLVKLFIKERNDIFSLKGGINAWKENNLPLSNKPN